MEDNLNFIREMYSRKSTVRRNQKPFGPSKRGLVQAKDCLGHTLATIYFGLAEGTPTQRVQAEEFRKMVLEMGSALS